MKTPDLVYATTIETTPEKLWQALTNPEFTKQYWFGNANFADSWKAGEAWQHKGIDSGNVHHEGKILECDPPKRLVLSWHNPGDDKDVSKVTFAITQSGETCELKIVHGDFIDDSAMAKRVSGGWPKVVANMKEFLEGSEASHKSGCAA